MFINCDGNEWINNSLYSTPISNIVDWHASLPEEIRNVCGRDNYHYDCAHMSVEWSTVFTEAMQTTHKRETCEDEKCFC